jgi:hypothetical protein
LKQINAWQRKLSVQNQSPNPQQQRKPSERVHQDKAFALIHKIDWWFRRHYNLAPTDPRYLDMTPEGMEIEYWAHTFTERWEQIIKDGGKVKSIEDLIDEGKAMGDDEFDRQLQQLEQESAATKAAVDQPSRVTPRPDSVPSSPVIHIRRPFHGRR